MFNFKSFVIILVFVGACNFRYEPYRFVLEEDQVELIYGREMSPELLDSIANVLFKNGIGLTHTEKKYVGGVLSKLSFTLDFAGKHGEATTNFQNKGYDFGFRIHRRNGQMEIGEIHH